ncbi:MAG: gliding motility-associated C-terminal domain-containing protein [Lewinellaceae bacterium]|nr:gliding motility-associated C-terminal domain-containing protein [Lewinellaceae bacterium]
MFRLICRMILGAGLTLLALPFLPAQNTFQKQLEGLNGIFCLEQTVDGTYWLGTFLGKIIRLDANGNWIGAYTLQKGDTAATRFIYDLQRAPNGDVWALYDRNNNNTALDDYLILARLTPGGLPAWQTSVHYSEVLHWAHNRLSSDPAGNAYAMSARFSAPGSSQPSRIILTKVDPGGSVLWSKAYVNTGVNYPRTLNRLSDGSYLICGNGQLAALYGFVLRLSPEGDVLWSRRYNRFQFKAFAELPDGGWVFAATEAGALPQKTCVLRLDESGNVLWAKRLIQTNALNWLPGLQISPLGDVLLFNYETAKDQPVADMICLSPGGAFKWAKRYDICRNYGISAGITTIDGGIAGVRFRSGGHLFLKTDASGVCNSCPADDVVLDMADVNDTPLSIDWQIQDRPPPGPADSDFLPFSTVLSDYCGDEKSITGISVDPDSVCIFQPLSASTAGPGVADQYHWFFPGAQPPEISGYSGLGNIRFNTAGTASVTLVARTGFCSDTFSRMVTVLPGPKPFDLGNDTLVCGDGVSLTLDASDAGAAAYTWQDGSSGPTLLAKKTGRYYVEAGTGACTVTDTIDVQVIEHFDVNLPGDTTICGTDTLWLDATTDFAESYLWNDGYQTAIRPVTKQGYYAVSAFLDNCSASDFIAVSPFPSPLPLPTDTTVCGDEPLEFSVGESIAGMILWNGEPGYSLFSFADTGWVRRRVEYRNCLFEDSVHVRRADCPEGFAYYAPNVFSPNGDGENDFFSITGPGLVVLAFQVYDRWGSQLYSSQTETFDQWDGNAAGNRPEAGVYIWVAQVKQGDRSGWISGDVLLYR